MIHNSLFESFDAKKGRKKLMVEPQPWKHPLSSIHQAIYFMIPPLPRRGGALGPRESPAWTQKSLIPGNREEDDVDKSFGGKKKR